MDNMLHTINSINALLGMSLLSQHQQQLLVDTRTQMLENMIACNTHTQILKNQNNDSCKLCPPVYETNTPNIYGGWSSYPVYPMGTISPEPPLKSNCVNCGAPLKGKHTCEYCETYNR